MSANFKTDILEHVHAKSISTPSLTVGNRGTNGWVSYTPTLTATTTAPAFGGTATVDGKYQLVGDTLDVAVIIETSVASGNAGSGTYLFSLPRGFTPKFSDEICGFGTVRANTFRAHVYAQTFGSNSVVLVAHITEASAVGGNILVDSSNYDTASTGGVTYRFRLRFQIA
jgi:hypothetical protein